MRGEYCATATPRCGIRELPPRARRIPPHPAQSCRTRGTTSACAENTTTPRTILPYSRNYLRVRGEYLLSGFYSRDGWELPPRARRIHHRHGIGTSGQGTTSACAENTLLPASNSLHLWNYLRVRGEYTKKPEKTSFTVELPPRARRIPNEADLRPGVVGTTSACAENTKSRRSRLSRPWNYLRVRGEYGFSGSARACRRELPPRARRILVVS